MTHSFLKKHELNILISLSIVFAIFSISMFLCISPSSQFTELAWSFLHGKTYFINEVESVDLVLYDQKTYWPLAPFPAVIIMPLVLVTKNTLSQTPVSFVFIIITICIIYLFIRRKLNFSQTNAYWLTLLYLFSSVFIIMIFPLPYYYVHILTTLFIFLSLYEYFGKKRYWLIGLLLAATFMTRFTAGFSVLFFILSIIFAKNNTEQKLYHLAQLFVPIFIAGLLLLGYNQIRFDNPLKNGYTMVNEYEDRWLIREHGLFDISYIPTNFYYYFIESFQPVLAENNFNNNNYHLAFPYIKPHVSGSTSFFIVAPLFLLLFKADYKNKKNLFLGLTCLVILAFILCYYYNGYHQIGPRYFNDFLPLLFTILLFTFKRNGLNYKHKIIITFSAFLNIYTAYLLFFFN